MVQSKHRTTLAIAMVVFLVGAGAALAAQSAGTWSGTVAAVSGDDIALVGVPAHFRLAGSVTEMSSGRSLAPQTLAPGTSVTLRVGERGSDGRLRADHVSVQSKSPLSVTGAIGRISDDRRHIEVQGVEIELDRSTGFSGRGSSGTLRSARDLRSGGTVSVSLVPTTAGTLRAAQVRAASSPAETGEDQEIKGVVTAVTDTVWTIDTTSYSVTDQTVFEGDPGMGDFVEVKFHDDGAGALVAGRISKEDDGAGEAEFRGIVEAIGDSSWTISGQVVGVDAATQILGSPVVGSAVEVHAVKAADGSLLAREITLEDGAEDQNDDHGNDGGNNDGGDDNGGNGNGGTNGTGGGADDGSNNSAGDHNGGNTNTGGTGSNSGGGSSHGHGGGDDSGTDN